MRFYLFLVTLIAGAVLVSSCSGPKEATDRAPERTVSLEDVETFDAEPYQIEAAPERSFELTHRVPRSLLEPSDSLAGSTSRSLVLRSGYRVQVFSGEQKSNADERLQQALTWWQNEGQDLDGASSVFSGSLPIRIVYNAPYYKVRIGDFLNRQAAQESLKLIRKQIGRASCRERVYCEV